MESSHDVVRDFRGAVMFRCRNCGQPLTADDFFHLGLRLPDEGEERDDYCAAELIDDATHLSCLRARRAG